MSDSKPVTPGDLRKLVGNAQKGQEQFDRAGKLAADCQVSALSSMAPSSGSSRTCVDRSGTAETYRRFGG
jgi:hypothetical protein